MFRESLTRKWSPPFAKPSNAVAFYDLIQDYELIEASFAQQYGIRLRREDDMSWDEFSTLLAGLNGDTPLGHIVSIRAETDKERLKQFTPAERKIRNEWRMRHRSVITDKTENQKAIESFHAMFKELSQKGG